MQTALEAVTAVKAAADVADAEVRVCRRCEVGTRFQQGDVYWQRLPDDAKIGKLLSKGDTKVAVGQGEGSNHIAVGDIETYEAVGLPPGVRFPNNIDWKLLCGPIVKAKKPWRMEHPKHPHHELPEGMYGVFYQLDPRTMRKSAD